MNWDYLQKHWDWAGHIVEALFMAAIVAMIVHVFLSWRLSWIVGFAFAAGHFHGREKRDYEVSVDMNPPHLEGYYFWRWSWDGATDFWPSAIICFALIFIVGKNSAGPR